MDLLPSRVSILLCTNATGRDKRKPLVICERLPIKLQSSILKDIDVDTADNLIGNNAEELQEDLFSDYWLRMEWTHYITVVLGKGPDSSTLESAREVLTSGKYEDLFVQCRKDDVGATHNSTEVVAEVAKANENEDGSEDGDRTENGLLPDDAYSNDTANEEPAVEPVVKPVAEPVVEQVGWSADDMAKYLRMSQKRSADIPVLNVKAKVIKSWDSNSGQDDVAVGDEDVIEGDRKSPDAAYTAEEDESKEDYQTWEERQKIGNLLHEFRSEDIYSCMETALHLRAIPYSDSKDVGDSSTDRSPKIARSSRVSILLCANATGSDNQKLMIMCKRLPLRLQDKPNRDMNIAIFDDGFMTARIFSYLLQKLDRGMGQQGRHIALMEFEDLGMKEDELDDQRSLVDRYRNRYYEYPGEFDGLDYIDILDSNGPNEVTLESVRETLDSGEYKDMFVDHTEEDGVGVGEVVKDSPLPAGDIPANPVNEEEN
ncbi:hypothetical protein BG015_009568 [Linnemannia schmuckeri]|uniref:Uncharacterized protein n=1 Tax=Linnemannia schmuckeri TaxID=64567 RepID=A0A9P5RVB9_9FUNG|nr:hypothetical protein BG015_009568 [Linnemannia schmuckeri]